MADVACASAAVAIATGPRGGITAPRVQGGLRALRHQGGRVLRSTWPCSHRPIARDRGGTVHDEPRSGGARAGLAAHLDSANGAEPAPSSSTAAAPTPAPATRAGSTPCRWPRKRPPHSAARRTKCSSPVPGVIGVALKIDRVVVRHSQAPSADSVATGGRDASRAIMTTDPFPKEHAVTVQTAQRIVHGRRHGEGLRHDRAEHGDDARIPDDRRAGVAGDAATGRCGASARDTFNAITVDGECSTNDSLFALASGASGVTIDEETYPALLEGMLAVSRELAVAIVRGGEGATKLIAVTVSGARTIRRRATGGAGRSPTPRS